MSFDICSNKAIFTSFCEQFYLYAVCVMIRVELTYFKLNYNESAQVEHDRGFSRKYIRLKKK